MSQSRALRAITIPADRTQPVTIEVVDASPAGLVTAVGGGQPQPVSLGDADAVAYCNEYGKIMRLSPNSRATRLVNRYVPGFARNDMIMGPIIIIGRAEDGTSQDVPEALAEAALAA
jgi:hypothetical protein